MKLLVYIVHHGRFSLLRECCHSLIPELDAESEVFVLLNGPQPEALAWLKDLAHPAFHWLEVPREPRTRARNRAWAREDAEIIYFIDDDVVIPPGTLAYLRRCFRADPQLTVLGGPNLTPPGSSWRARLFGAIMTSHFAAPLVNARYRTLGAEPRFASERDLILCNLAFRRALVPPGLKFREELVSNEENYLLDVCRQQRLGVKACGKLAVYHHRRHRLRDFLRQIFSYGTGRGQQLYLAPLANHILFWLPPLALTALVILAGLGQWKWLAALAALHVAFSTVAALCSEEIRSLGWLGLSTTVPLTGVLHVVYAAGIWRGCSRQFVYAQED